MTEVILFGRVVAAGGIHADVQREKGREVANW